MKMSPSDTSVKSRGARRSRWWVVLATFAAFVWSLPRPMLQDVVIETAEDSSTPPPRGRLAFRTAELLAEFSGKGSLADETELSGPCFELDGQTLYFSRSRPGQRADIVRSTFNGERWAKPESVRELNSVDDDRRLTMSSDGRTAALASNRSGGHGGFDLYESTRDGDRWSRPTNVGSVINTDADEFDPALSPDGRTLFFVRVVSGAGAELFVTRREAVDANWSTPEPVAAVNNSDSHERSPAISPDEKWLLFSSNRGSRSGESAPFRLFRTPLRDGQVVRAVPFRDGITSDADDLDVAFSPDGRTLVLASKRDGPKQLFFSRGDYVVSRLTFSTAHLEQFGRAKWGVPFLGALMFAAVWRWSRRVRVVSTIVATPAPAAAVVLPPRRSEPPQNPLAKWTNTEPAAPATTKKSNPLLTSASLPDAPAESPATDTPKKLPSRDSARPARRRVAIALLLLAASLAIAVRFNFLNLTANSVDAPIVNNAQWQDVVEFAEVAPTLPLELPKLGRFDTARADAPQPFPIPSASVALRPAARWPTDRVVVRSLSEIARVANIEPFASKQTRLISLARRSGPADLARPTTRPGEETSLASTVVPREAPHVAAPIATAKQFFDPQTSELTGVSPATLRSATISRPSLRVELRSQITHVSDIEPAASRQLLLSSIARRSATGELTRSTTRPAEETALVSTVIPSETPHVAPATTTVKQFFDPQTAELTVVSPATLQSATLSKPSLRVEQFALTLPQFSAPGPGASGLLARRGASDQLVEPISLADSQAIAELVPVVSAEPPPLQAKMVVARVEPTQVGQPGASEIVARSLLPPSRDATSVAGLFIDLFVASTFNPQLLTKSSTEVKAAMLMEAAVPLPKEEATEFSLAAAAISSSRIESPGPQPILSADTSTVAITTHADLSLMRSPNRIDVVAAHDDLGQSSSNLPWLSQHVTRWPVIATAAPESADGLMPGGPAILLTSATRLVELLASPPLTPLPRAESSGPTPSNASESFSSLAKWFSQAAKPAVLEGGSLAIEPRSSTPLPIVPRRERPLSAAELPEDIK